MENPMKMSKECDNESRKKTNRPRKQRLQQRTKLEKHKHSTSGKEPAIGQAMQLGKLCNWASYAIGQAMFDWSCEEGCMRRDLY